MKVGHTSIRLQEVDPIRRRLTPIDKSKASASCPVPIPVPIYVSIPVLLLCRGNGYEYFLSFEFSNLYLTFLKK